MSASSQPFEALDRLNRLVTAATTARPAFSAQGTVARISPSFITVAGLSRFVSIGEAVSIATNSGDLIAEVANIDRETINVTPVAMGMKVELGASVTALCGPIALSPHESWLGRAVNPVGEPIDDLGPLQPGPRTIPIHNGAPKAMSRERLGKHLVTGVKAIDLFTPVCAGQRVGIFAGSGVGKSTLLAMLSRAMAFDVVVLSLVGERGREVRDFLDDAMAECRDKVVAVVATADESPMMRRLAPTSAMCLAEYFRDLGRNVLLIVDSITRYAHAIRELALASNEPPVARGFPPSVFGALPRLLERAGPGAEGSGTISAIISVLVDGDDHNDPIADAVRGILDGHIVLDRAIAAQGRYPAIDPLASISRLAPKIRGKNEATFAAQIIELVSRYEDSRDLRTIGGYRPGSDAQLDRAVQIVPRLYEAMKQDLNDEPVGDVFAYLAEKLQAPPN